MTLTQKDICLTIPTYNRSEDVDKTLSLLIKNNNIPGKIFVVDQSSNDKTKEVVKKYERKLPIKYVFLKDPSSSIAENTGVKMGLKFHQLFLIIGDDVDLLPNYLTNLLDEFNKNPKLMGFGGADKSIEYNFNNLKNRLSTIFLKIFLLPHMDKRKFRINGPYGNTIAPKVINEDKEAQWIPGFNNCFRKEIYQNYNFPEIKGYNVLEDIDCSYQTYLKYGKGSLLITPRCKVVHRWSPAERYPEKKRIFANHEDHFSFYYRNFNNLLGLLKLNWSLIGIILGNLALFLGKPNKKHWLKLIYNLQAIRYCKKHRKQIKQGQHRIFLNPDLTMKNIL